MQRWEYLTIFVSRLEWKDSLGRTGKLPGFRADDGDPTGLLNEVGEQGWELAGVNTYRGGYAPTLFLKRPRQ